MTLHYFNLYMQEMALQSGAISYVSLIRTFFNSVIKLSRIPHVRSVLSKNFIEICIYGDFRSYLIILHVINQ